MKFLHFHSFRKFLCSILYFFFVFSSVEEEAYEEVEEEAPKDETEIEVELHSAVLNGLSMLIVFFRLMLFKF